MQNSDDLKNETTVMVDHRCFQGLEKPLWNSDKGNFLQWAFEIMADRFEQVEKYLNLAAYQSVRDAEYVHQLRVATRRAMAAIRLLRKWFNRKKSKRLIACLSKIRKAAGEARDIDVFIATQKKLRLRDGEKVEKVLRGIRKRVQKPILKIEKRFSQNNELNALAVECFQSAIKRKSPKNRKQLVKWLQGRLRKKTRALFACKPTTASNLQRLHVFRIQCKELRYTMELVDMFPDQQAYTKSLKGLAQIQDLLGDINDQVVACSGLKQWVLKCRKHDAKVLKKQLKTQSRELKQMEKDLGESVRLLPLKRLEKNLKAYCRGFSNQKMSRRKMIAE